MSVDAVTAFADHQNGVYTGGGVDRAHLPLRTEDLQRAFDAAVPQGPRDYVNGGAGNEATVRANRAAFENVQIVPRMMRDVSVRSSTTRLLGIDWPAPIGLAPIGVQSIVAPEGELAVARAAAAVGLPFTASTAASHTLEEVAEAGRGAPQMFQLYWPKDPELCTSLLQRAGRAGYRAIVVTLDTWLLGWRPRDLQSGYLPFLQGVGLANYFADPVFRARLVDGPADDLAAAVKLWTSTFSDASIGWDDLQLVRDATDLPIVLKGVQHPDDARRALECGVDGLVVSNHGGRQVDGAVGALSALAGIVDAVDGRSAVLFDSGVRSGCDVFKALALGADAVLLGRPYMWALGTGGGVAVELLLRNLLAELDLTMALSGLASVDQITSEAVIGGSR